MYQRHGEQGSFTDVYAICATIYYMLTGKAPDEAIDRILGDETQSLVGMQGIRASKEFCKNIMKGISLKPNERFATMKELESAIYVEKKRKEVGLFVLAAILFFLAAVGTFFLPKKEETITTSGLPEPTPQSYEMISGIGKTKQEILAILPGLEEQAVVVTWKRVYHDTVKKGTVIAQSIPEKTKYSKEETVHVIFTLSKGVKKITVPSVVGMNYKVAEKKIKEKGFSCRIVWQENQSEANHDVISQSIQAGTKKIKKHVLHYMFQKEKKKKQVIMMV